MTEDGIGSMDDGCGTREEDSFRKFDEFAKSAALVMPDLIRHPELIEMTG
ncbi:hypothetical protein DSCW_36940 [Desulfosarcina widdelii]|uniref:Uncharacterized protein n=1 Tax=Desulfosarcina widdelii TaxID=947919 RepID=A0A5K7ZJN6_9BACT|nr:hypothetical protein DSCW_36940 [Desulfosarcina widdelii]